MSSMTRTRQPRTLAFAALLTLGAAGLPGVVGCDAEGNLVGSLPDTTPSDVETTSSAVATTATSYVLVLDGTVVGPVKSFSGGNASAPVITETIGGASTPVKRLGTVSYENISFDIDSGTAAVFWQWVNDTMSRRFAKRSGSIVSVDASLKEVERMNFFDAGLAEIAFPGFDAASKASAPFKIKLRPTTTQVVPGNGAAAPALPLAKTSLVASQYRLAISGLTTTKVMRMPPFVVNVTVPPTGSNAWALSIPNVAFSVAGVVTDWNAWAQDFIVKGNNGAAAEKTGSLSYLAGDLKTIILTVDFTGMGVFRTSADPASPTGTVRLLAEMYAENAKLSSLPPQ
jgi:hypothetical protein